MSLTPRGRQLALRRCALAPALALLLLPSGAGGQQPAAQSPDLPRTAWGDPDLQGLWTMATYTPLQRPERFRDREFLTDEEMQELTRIVTAEGTDPLTRNVLNDDPERLRARRIQTQENIHYDNAIWLTEERPKSLSSARTSLIVDPPNGRIPSTTEEGAARQAERQRDSHYLVNNLREPVYDGYHTRTVAERCLVWRHEGPPMVPAAYNDILQIFQTPDHVVVFQEMSNNNPRIIPMDGRPHLSESIRLWPGDSRGHWEGDTLVVETTNFNGKTHYQGASEDLRVVERFRRVAEDRIHYEWTVEDERTWARPWTAEIPMARTDELMYEYACHEGNYDLPNILSIARNLERQAAERERSGSR